MDSIPRCYICKQLPEVCALNPAVCHFSQSTESHIYQLKWTRFNGYLLSNSGKLSSWGKPTSARGRIKTPQGKNDEEPIPVPIFLRIIIVEISCGTNHILALEAQLFVWSWGYNAKGQLGIPEATPEEQAQNPEDAEKMMQRRPERLNKLNEICRIYANYDMSFAVSIKGKLFCWGDNTRHQLCLLDPIVHQPKFAQDMPWYEGGKKAAAGKLEDEKNEALEKVMARLDISEMKLLKEDNRDLKRRLTNHVKKLNEKEASAFMEGDDTESHEENELTPKFQFESTSKINDSIVELIHESLSKKISIENEIGQQKEQLVALERKIEGLLERSNTLSETIRNAEPQLDSMRGEISIAEEKMRMELAKREAEADADDETTQGRGVLDTPASDDILEDLDTKLRDLQRDYSQAKSSYDGQISEKAKLYQELADHQREHSTQSQKIQSSKVERDRLEQLIEVYHTTNRLTEDKLSDDYFESHKKVITANLNFLHKTQVILNETLIMELSKVVPISSMLDLLDVSRTIMTTMDDEIRKGIKTFNIAAMRKLNRLWRIVGMNYALMGFVQDAIEELIRSTHHEVISEDKYHPNPYWNAKRQEKKPKTTVAGTNTPFTRDKSKDDPTRHYRECCF